PTIGTAERDSASQAYATTVAATGSSIATIPARVADTWRRAATTSPNGTIVPKSTIQAISTQTGRCRSARFPSSETSRPGTAPGKLHHGWTIAQKNAAKKNP